MDLLKELLGELFTDAIAEKVGNVKLIVDDGKLIPKYRLDEVIAEKKSLETQIKQYEDDLKAAKKAASGNDELVAQIDAMQKAAKAQKEEAEVARIKDKKAYAVRDALRFAGVDTEKACDMLSREFDLEAIELDEHGKVKGFDALVKPLQDDPVTGKLFGKEKIVGDKPDIGKNPEFGVKNPFVKGENFSLEGQIKLKRENPALYEKMKASAH